MKDPRFQETTRKLLRRADKDINAFCKGIRARRMESIYGYRAWNALWWMYNGIPTLAAVDLMAIGLSGTIPDGKGSILHYGKAAGPDYPIRWEHPNGVDWAKVAAEWKVNNAD